MFQDTVKAEPQATQVDGFRRSTHLPYAVEPRVVSGTPDISKTAQHDAGPANNDVADVDEGTGDARGNLDETRGSGLGLKTDDDICQDRGRS